MSHPFAPGAIEHHRRTFGSPAQRRELVRWLKLSALVVSASGLVGFVAGVLA